MESTKIYETVTTGITLTDIRYYNQYSAKFLTMKISQVWNNKQKKTNTSYADNVVSDMLQVLSCNNIFKQEDLNC